jgi:ubiquinone biosynthesis UbiH/UbiF/VisC/COQ6 family hydroxylase
MIDVNCRGASRHYPPLDIGEVRMNETCEVLVVGAGPAGLSLAVALASDGIDVVVVEKASRTSLAAPAVDGRDIALTHRAVDILDRLGCWQQYTSEDIAPIRRARVLNGLSPAGLNFDVGGTGKDELGYLVPNHVIRRAAYTAATAQPRVTLIDGVSVDEVEIGAQAADARLSDGRTLRARLLIAADSRFSPTRRRLGIGAEMQDFGRTVIVCRMQLERPHDGIATECFHYGHTLAVLPLNGNLASIVVTVGTDRAEAMMRMDGPDFDALVTGYFGARLGQMRLEGDRHAYPLVAVYAHRFSGHRCALLGDAAVGMHPVTAHGFNFGLYGIETLRGIVADARAAHRDIGDATLLRQYDRRHRRATRPIYVGTNMLVGLFTDDRVPTRLLRSGVLRVAEHLPPLKAGISRLLTGTGPTARQQMEARCRPVSAAATANASLA